MAKIAEILSGMGILIAIFLFVSHATESARIINALGSNTTAAIKTLQGR